MAGGRNLNSGDAVGDSYMLASYERLLGDAKLRAGDRPGAMSSWLSGLSALPKDAVERPWELNERFQLLRRLGRAKDAQPIGAKLAALNYRGI